MASCVAKEIKVKSLKLFHLYQKNPSTCLRNQIVELNVGLVKREANHWIYQCNETYDDLLQVGSLGLIRAIEKFDVEKGSAFSSFAMPYIRGEIQHYLRDKSCTVRIPRKWLEKKQKSTSFIRKFRAANNRQPQDLEIANYLQISLKEWQDVKLAYQNRKPMSLDVSVNKENQDQSCLGDLVPDPKYRSFQLASEDRIRLQQALGQLEDRTRNVLEFVFLQDLTQKETAQRLGISVVTVSRQLKKGLSSLQDFMQEE